MPDGPMLGTAGEKIEAGDVVEIVVGPKGELVVVPFNHREVAPPPPPEVGDWELSVDRPGQFMRGPRERDPAWRFRCGCSAVHYWNRPVSKLSGIRLAVHKDSVEIDSDGEEWSRSWWECSRCGETIPLGKATKEGEEVWVPGLVTATVEHHTERHGRPSHRVYRLGGDDEVRRLLELRDFEAFLGEQTDEWADAHLIEETVR